MARVVLNCCQQGKRSLSREVRSFSEFPSDVAYPETTLTKTGLFFGDSQK